MMQNDEYFDAYDTYNIYKFITSFDFPRYSTVYKATTSLVHTRYNSLVFGKEKMVFIFKSCGPH